MKFTKGQQVAFDKTMKWIDNNDPNKPFFTLAGFAGTGKTTLLRYIIDAMKTPPLCCAPTAKAASVLSSKLQDIEVLTVHKVLYAPVSRSGQNLASLAHQISLDPDNNELIAAFEKEKQEMANTKLQFVNKVKPGSYAGLVIFVDEGSMLTGYMAQDFYESGARVVVIGDPGQLPPVGGSNWFDEAKPHDVTLTEVTRQALDSGIIRLSMEIRERGFCNPEKYNGSDVLISSKHDIDHSLWLESDQVLTGPNVLRRKINRFFRNMKGFEGKLPKANEKLICIRNDPMTYGLVNGLPATSLDDTKVDEDGQYRLSLITDDQVKPDLPINEFPFHVTYDNRVTDLPWTMKEGLVEFDWAYAITTHKSQGSEWPNVLIADDGFWGNRPIDRKRWLYTGITRAKQKLTWVTEE